MKTFKSENDARNAVIDVLLGWLGLSEVNGGHRKIIDIYNQQKPLPVGYKVKYSDDWCAAGVTAAFIKAGVPEIHFPECSCPRMIDGYKKMGRWMEADDYVPQPGDLIMYDWEDSNEGDNTGTPNHVGMVVKLSGEMVRVIECNRNVSVTYRYVYIGQRYIRGYCLPDYQMATEQATEPPYKYLRNVPEWHKPAIIALMDAGALVGQEDPVPGSHDDNILNLSEDFCRIMTILHNLNLF